MPCLYAEYPVKYAEYSNAKVELPTARSTSCRRPNSRDLEVWLAPQGCFVMFLSCFLERQVPGQVDTGASQGPGPGPRCCDSILCMFVTPRLIDMRFNGTG